MSTNRRRTLSLTITTLASHAYEARNSAYVAVTEPTGNDEVGVVD